MGGHIDTFRWSPGRWRRWLRDQDHRRDRRSRRVGEPADGGDRNQAADHRGARARSAHLDGHGAQGRPGAGQLGDAAIHDHAVRPPIRHRLAQTYDEGFTERPQRAPQARVPRVARVRGDVDLAVGTRSAGLLGLDAQAVVRRAVARAAHHRSPGRARSEGGAAGDCRAADDVEVGRGAVRARAEERAGRHRVDQRALRARRKGQGPSGRRDAAVVRHRADGRRGRGARGARTHPARRQHRCRPADDRSGTGRRIDPRHAGRRRPTPRT